MSQADPPVDIDALGRWLQEREICSGPITLTRIGEGHSNITYAVDDGTRRVVLRRAPPPPLPPNGHDMAREARMLRALEPTDVPTPAVLAVAEAGEVMDVPFFVMEHLDGEVCTTALPESLETPQQREAIGHELIDVLVRLHMVDWAAVGLADFGRPQGFIDRQLDRLPGLIADADGALPPEFEELRERLRARQPVSRYTGIVHGDFRLGNVMLARDAPARIIGVFDWEFVAIGDTLADLGYVLGTYASREVALNSVTEMSTATLSEGFPSRAQLAERYAAATGRDVGDVAWYEAMQLFKLAVIFEYNRRMIGPGRDPFWHHPTLVSGLLEAVDLALTQHDRSQTATRR